MRKYLPVLAFFVPVWLAGCKHTVQIEPSDKPFVINLNVNINQEIRVKLDKDIEDMLASNPDIF